jgi:hypothetical protein
MTATETPLTLVDNSDPLVDITVTQNGAPYDLTGATVEIIVKHTADTPDANALFKLSSTGTSPKITIASGTGGTATADFTGKLDNLVGRVLWYRLNVIKAGRRLPPAYGPLHIVIA